MGSDIDLLIVSKNFELFIGRFDIFNEIEKDLKTSKAYRDLKEKKLGTLISPIPHTPEEIKKSPPILLDIVTDGLILYDTDNFMTMHLTELRKKTREVGCTEDIFREWKMVLGLKT